jgi:glycerophosphoryl diester phosphodiesterase
MLVIGHRGALAEAPENTLDGFAHALGAGVDAVEFDVRLSRDDQLVVFHDPTVDRTTNATGPVGSFTAAELAQLDARAQFPGWPVRCGVPLFTEVLDVLGDTVRLMIEVKQEPEGREAVLHRIMKEIDRRAIGNLATITTGDPALLAVIQRDYPAQRRGYIGAWDTIEFLETSLRLECPHGDAHHVTASPDVVAAARAAGMTMLGWMCNSEAEFQKLRGWDVDAVTSDCPSRILALRGTLGSAAW